MLMDEDIRDHVVDHLIWDGRVDPTRVEVTVENGTVTLEGRVSSWRAKRAAEEAARAVPGVRVVDNQLAVEYAAEALPDDEEVARRVQDALRWDPDIDENAVTVEVRDGVVALSGTVDALWKRQVALDTAFNTIGVTGVTDQLVVEAPEEIEDDELEDDVEYMLSRDYLLDGADIGVRVEGGHVTLEGTVPNWAAHNEAVAVAYFTPGVIDVHDELAVATEE